MQVTMTKLEHQTLKDIAEGLTDKAIAERHSISVRGVQHRVGKLMDAMGVFHGEQYNVRTRLIALAIRRGLLTLGDFSV